MEWAVRGWEDYIADQELAEIGKWVDELADTLSEHPENIANIVIDNGFVPESLFDEIVDYVERRRVAS